MADGDTTAPPGGADMEDGVITEDLSISTKNDKKTRPSISDNPLVITYPSLKSVFSEIKVRT